MLRVSIHAGAPDSASRFNLVAWVDIGYDQLAPIADYKTVLFQTGVGAALMAPIYKYPRWSTSLWDLVARSIALGLRTDLDCLNEEVPPVILTRKRSAFANQVCALIEHLPPNGVGRRTLATVDIKQVGRTRGTYVAKFTEDAMPMRVTEPFQMAPDVLRPAELLLHACLMRLSGKQELPPRPALPLPNPVKVDEEDYVPIQKLGEPARTGFLRWLFANGITPIPHAGYDQGLAQVSLYSRFLTEAV